jgi:hypothetical protein
MSKNDVLCRPFLGVGQLNPVFREKGVDRYEIFPSFNNIGEGIISGWISFVKKKIQKI